MDRTLERELPVERRDEPFTVTGFVSALGVSRSSTYRLLRAGTIKEAGTLGQAFDSYHAWRLAAAETDDDAALRKARGVVYDGRREREIARLAEIERTHIRADVAERILTRMCARLAKRFVDISEFAFGLDLDDETLLGVADGAAMLRDRLASVRGGETGLAIEDDAP